MRKYRLAVSNGSNDNIHKPPYNASRTKVPEGNKAGGVEKQKDQAQYVTVGPTPDWTSVEVTQPSGSSKAGIAFGILAGFLALIGGGLLFAL